MDSYINQIRYIFLVGNLFVCIALPQTNPIFYSSYYPVTLGRSILLQTKIHEPLLISISNRKVAELKSMVVRGLRRGRATVYAETQNHLIKDSTEIVVTEWLSGFSSLTITDSLPDFYTTLVTNDSIYGFGEHWGQPTAELRMVNESFSGTRILSSFSTAPQWMLRTQAGYLILGRKADINSPKTLYKSANLTEWRAVLDTFPTAGPGRTPDSYVLYQGWDADKDGNIYIAEYLSEDSVFPNYQLHIFKSSDWGESWCAAYTFPPRSEPGATGGVRHLHTIAIDPYQGYIWLSTGDNHAQSRIYYHTNKLLPDSDGVVRLKLLGNYHEEFKAVSFAFTKDYVYWFMDSPTDTQKIFRVPKMETYPTITSLNDYRECLGIFRDKAFWHNIPVLVNGDSCFLMETCFEKNYAPIIDTRSRSFILKEKPTVQIQEIYAAETFGNYSHFYPRGQLSDGSVIFTGLKTVHPRDYAFKTKLNWVDVDENDIVTGEQPPAGLYFPRLALTLRGRFSGNGRVYGLRQPENRLPVALPDTLSLADKAYFEFFSLSSTLDSGFITITAPLGGTPPLDSLIWVYYDRENSRWLPLGISRKGQMVSNIHPMPSFGWIALVQKKPQIPTDGDESGVNDFQISELYPNPFNPSVKLQLQINELSKVSANVYSVLGEQVCALTDNVFEKGTHTISWMPLNTVAGGIYFVRINASDAAGNNSFAKTFKAVYKK